LWYADELMEWKLRWLASLPRRKYTAESYREAPAEKKPRGEAGNEGAEAA
jgi:hypothetical protein